MGAAIELIKQQKKKRYDRLGSYPDNCHSKQVNRERIYEEGSERSNNNSNKYSDGHSDR